MIKDLFSTQKPLLSFEVYPPKQEDAFRTAFQTLDSLASHRPDFISVTYGAGGSKSGKTIEIASYIQNKLHIDALAHITCVGSTEADILKVCRNLRQENISHVLALRGDRPAWMSDEQFCAREFTYASDLVRFLQQNSDFEIAGACYPEKHYEAEDFASDLEHLKEKTDAGAEFLITQLFFDNEFFYRFLEKARAAGITAPICAGIMPITSSKQLGTSVSLSGSSLPKEFTDMIAVYSNNPEDMRKAGTDYAIRQILDLRRHGADGIHIYTLNRAKTTANIIAGIN